MTIDSATKYVTHAVDHHYECNKNVAACLALAIGSVALGVIIGYLGKLCCDHQAKKDLQGGNVQQIEHGFWDYTIKNVSPEARAKTTRERGKIFLYTCSAFGVIVGGMCTVAAYKNSYI